LVHPNARFQQLFTETALKTQCEFRFHGWTEIAEPSQGNQRRFHPAIEIAAADVQDA
jgi:hypothetical protein